MKAKKIKKAIRKMVKMGVMTKGEASAYCEAVNHSIAQSKKWEEKIQSTIAVLEKMRDEGIKMPTPLTREEVMGNYLIYEYMIDPAKSRGNYCSND